MEKYKVRSLNWKLSGALLLIVMISVGLMAWLTNLSTASEFRQYITSGNMMYAQSLSENLGDYYTEQGSWDDLQPLLENLPTSTSQRIVVVDDNGVIIGDSLDEWLGDDAEDIGLSGGTTIDASGKEAGTLYLLSSGTMGMGRGRMGWQSGMMMAPVAQDSEEDFLDEINNSLWKVGLIAAAAALVVGLVLTRQITRPVKALIKGVRHLSKGELDYRVDVSSHDEIGELADSFNSMASSLEKIEQSRRQLTADIAHELRTPLTIIEGTVNGIMDGVFDADPEHLGSIKEQSLLLTRLISDLRDISLAESGQLKLDLTPTNIIDLVKKVVSACEISASEKDIRIEMDAAPESPEVNIDPMRIEQVITNLVMNAIRHTPSGGLITVGVRSGDSLMISVKDTGEGISPEDLPHVFERFYRSGASRSRKQGGTGLGLAIVKQMVEAHGGTVTAESTPGAGSIFQVNLPFHR